MIKKKALGIVGLPGSGKSTAIRIADKYAPIITMGDIIREETDKRGLARNPENLGKIAKELRISEGLNAVAAHCISKIESISSKTFIIDGIRSNEEVIFFRDFLQLEILAIITPDESRFTWLGQRGRDDDSQNLEILKRRDIREKEFGIEKVIAEADYKIHNLGTIEELENKCRLIFQQVFQID